jgi:hypothetical protein
MQITMLRVCDLYASGQDVARPLSYGLDGDYSWPCRGESRKDRSYQGRLRRVLNRFLRLIILNLLMSPQVVVQ